MIASIVWDVDPILFKVGSWEVRWYGLMWGLGFILAYEMVSITKVAENVSDNEEAEVI